MPFGPFPHGWPYSNFHDLNLDWVISVIRELETKITQFVALNTIEYADPFQWDITRQYEKNVIVFNTENKTAYISVDAVPYGTDITNTQYWTKVVDISSIYDQLVDAITSIKYEFFGLPAGNNINVGDLVWINDKLYKCKTNTNKNDTVSQDNFTETTLNVEFKNLVNENNSAITAAISELNARISTIIADGTPTEGNTELLDIRNGWNGTVYPTAGDAVRDQTENAYNEAELVKDSIDLNFENLLNENNIYINGAIITKTGAVTPDDRGFRIYVLKLGKDTQVTVSIDQNWFYVIQADSNKYIMSGDITGAAPSTYLDSSTLSPMTKATINMTHDYLWLCFMHSSPDESLDRYTSQIMVNAGSTALPYVPYKQGISINVKNLYSETSENVFFKQAYIKNQELVANQIETENNSVAQYTCLKMPSTIISVKAKVKFFGNGRAYSTFISEPNGMNTVEDITKKCIHINMSSKTCYIGYFTDKKLVNTHTAQYNASEGVEVEVGFEFDTNTNTLTVYLPDGTTYTEANTKYGECAGNYACWEHYINITSVQFSCNKFTKIYAKDTDGNFVLDDFNRQNGAIGVCPQGYPYAQFNNLMQDPTDATL